MLADREHRLFEFSKSFFEQGLILRGDLNAKGRNSTDVLSAGEGETEKNRNEPTHR